VSMFAATRLQTAETRARLWNTRCAGKPAGYQMAKGYILIRQAGLFTVLAHRLAWFFTHEIWPTVDVDHINGDPSDNRLVNLRLATVSQNLWNCKGHRDSVTGVKGVYPDPVKGYRAKVMRGGRTYDAGRFDDLGDAKAARDALALRLHGEFMRD